MKIETRNLDELSIHPAIKNQPRLTEDELLEWRKGFKALGEDRVPAISISGENAIVDGRHRFWCAKALGWKTIPVEVIPDAEIMDRIVLSLVNRRTYTKSQLAYILCAPATFAPSAKLIYGSHGAIGDAKQSLAARIGVSQRFVAYAFELHELFADKTKRTITSSRDGKVEKNVTFKEFFEPRILLGEDPEVKEEPYGLGAVVSAINAILKMEEKGTPHGGGRPKNVEKQLDLFSTAAKNFGLKFEYWQKWEPETRQAAMASLAPMVEKMPDELLAEMAKAAKTELARRGTKTK